jgi:hypothetical protein
MAGDKGLRLISAGDCKSFFHNMMNASGVVGAMWKGRWIAVHINLNHKH